MKIIISVNDAGLFESDVIIPATWLRFASPKLNHTPASASSFCRSASSMYDTMLPTCTSIWVKLTPKYSHPHLATYVIAENRTDAHSNAFVSSMDQAYHEDGDGRCLDHASQYYKSRYQCKCNPVIVLEALLPRGSSSPWSCTHTCKRALPK